MSRSIQELAAAADACNAALAERAQQPRAVLGTLTSRSQAGDRRWQVCMLCVERGSAGAGASAHLAPLGCVAAQIELAYAERYGWSIVGEVTDRPPYTHQIAVRSWNGGVWLFLAYLEEQP